jgi:predicted enzyme related to lactoylglutathione lyase
MRRLSAVVVLLAAFGCGQTVPPVSPEPTGRKQPGKFVWLDLVTEDVAAVKAFYGGLFGWTFETAIGDGAYTLIEHDGRTIGGIVFSDQLNRESESRWVAYLSVEDVDSAAEEVRSSGGTVHIGPRSVPDRGRIAVVSDPQGAIVALIDAAGGDPADVDPGPGRWLWIELWTTNTRTAFEFYESLVGYERREFGEVDGEPYHLMRRDGRFRAGMVRLPWQGVQPNWLPYVQVADPAAIAAAAPGLGGRVILSPEGAVHDGVAILMDPSGAAFGVQRRPEREVPSE